MTGEGVFDEPWQAQTFALVVALNERGVFTWAEWSEAVAAAPEEGYYERWLATLERLLSERGLVADDTLGLFRHAWEHAAARTPHGTPIELRDEDFG